MTTLSTPLSSKRQAATWVAGAAAAVATVCLLGQGVHFVEHIGQLGYWFLHPSEPPWMTPWAMEGVYALTVGGNTATGVELLHLIGNGIFLAGLGALVFYCSTLGYSLKEARNLRLALYWQGAHMIEHVVLTATVLLVGKSLGLTTFFGLVDGPIMTSWRVWSHFILNLAGSWYAVKALLDLRDVKNGFREPNVAVHGLGGPVASQPSP